MREFLRVLLLALLFLQVGCNSSQNKAGPRVSIIDTLGGQKHIVSANIEEDGTFNNCVTEDGRIQTMSGKVSKPDNIYIVSINYRSTTGDLSNSRQINTRVSLKDGESQELAGLGAEGIVLKLSIE